jgi:hypothetical protein
LNIAIFEHVAYLTVNQALAFTELDLNHFIPDIQPDKTAPYKSLWPTEAMVVFIKTRNRNPFDHLAVWIRALSASTRKQLWFITRIEFYPSPAWVMFCPSIATP